MIKNCTLKTLFALLLGHFTIDFMLSIWPAYKTLTGIDLGQAAFLAGIGIALGELSQIFFGLLADRGYARALLPIGLLLSGMLALLAYFEHTLALFGLILCTYLGSSAYHPAACGLLSSFNSGKQAGLVSLFYFVGMLGSALSQSVFSFSFAYLNGNTAIWLIPTFLVAAFLAACSFPSGKGRQHPSFKEALLEIYAAKGAIAPLFVIQTLGQIVIFSLWFFLPEILLKKGFPKGFCLGGGYAAFVAGEAAAIFCGIWYLDRLHVKTALASATTLASFALLLLHFTEGLAAHAALLFLLGTSLGTIPPLVVAEGRKRVRTEVRSTAGGILMGASSACAALIIAFMGNCALLDSILYVIPFLATGKLLSIFFLPNTNESYRRIAAI